MAKSKRVAKVKRGKATKIERLVREDRVRADGSTERAGFTSTTKFKNSSGRVFIPRDNLPDKVVDATTERTIDGKTRHLQMVRNESADTEYYVSSTVFTVELHSNKFARKGFRSFCKRENIYFKDVPIDLQDWLDRKRIQGRCRVCDIVGLHDEVGKFVSNQDGETATAQQTENAERPKIKQGYTICIAFSGINETLRLKLMAENWVQASYTIRTRTPSNSSMLHRLGERLKYKKKYMFEKQEERNAFRALEESFIGNRQAAGHKSNKQIYDKLFKKDDSGKNYFTK